MNRMHDPRNYRVNEGRFSLGAILLLNLFSRVQCGICGPNPLPSRELTTATQVIDPGYCLDAPDVMPAGGMAAFEVDLSDGDPPVALPEQLLVYRSDGVV